MEIKDMLVALRKERNMTQKQVAELLGMSATGYASWEQGLAQPSLTYVKELCKLYGISADYILGIDE